MACWSLRNSICWTYILSDQGLKVDPKKIKDILNMPEPEYKAANRCITPDRSFIC